MKVEKDRSKAREETEQRRHAESMVLVLIWLLLEFAQQAFGPESSLWRGSYTFFFAWLLLTATKASGPSSLFRWMGLPVVSFLIAFPQSITAALIHALGVGFLLFGAHRWLGSTWSWKPAFLARAAAILAAFAALRVGLNQSLTLNQPLLGSLWLDTTELWLPATALHLVDLLAAGPFFLFVLLPILQIPFQVGQGGRNISWKTAALIAVALSFWGLTIGGYPVSFRSPWLWIVTLLLSSWAGIPGVLTAIYGAYVMNFGGVIEPQDLYHRIWQGMGLAALAFLFSSLAFRERNKLKVENGLLEAQRLSLQEKLFAEERQNQIMSSRMDSTQRLVLRTIQEMHAHLTPIVLSSKLLSQQAPNEKEGMGRILQGSAEKLMQLLQGMQDAIQIAGQGMLGQSQRVLVEQMFRELLPDLAPLAASRSVTISLGNVAPHVAVQSWPQALRESFESLLRHLILFGEEQSQIVIRIYVQPQKIHLQLRHSNYTNRQGVLAGLVDGNLMSKEALALAVNFDVGLYTACRLLESMGGQLSIFEKAAQHHLTFAIQLPVAQDDDLPIDAQVPMALDEILPTHALALTEPAEEAPRPQLVAVDGRLPPRRLLLVEDDKMTQELLKSILANTGIEVRSHENAQEAYESFCSFRPDVVIADLGLPDSNGFELMKRLRSVAKYEFYAIAFSANNHRNALKNALSAGFDSFLPKPLAIHDLCRALRIA